MDIGRIAGASLSKLPAPKVKFNDLPPEAVSSIMVHLKPKDIVNLGMTNKSRKTPINDALISSAIEDFIQQHNLTRPKGNPTDPLFLRAAIDEYTTRSGAGEPSETMRADLKASLDIHAEYVQEKTAPAPLFSIHEILTKPYKAAEFTGLSGFFDQSWQEVGDFQDIATAGGSEKVLAKIQEKGDVPGELSVKIQVYKDGSNKILTHMRENPAAWSQLNPLQVYHTTEALNAGGAATFVRDNPEAWLKLNVTQMLRTIEALNTGGDTAEFVKNNPAAWLKLSFNQMDNTKHALNAGGDAAEFIKNNPEAWLQLNAGKMYRTIEALNAGGDTAEFVKNNKDKWLQLHSLQMNSTRKLLSADSDTAEFVKNNPEAWLQLDHNRMSLTKHALLPRGAAAEFVKNNPEAWLQLDHNRMHYTTEALNTGGAPAVFVKNNLKKWLKLSSVQMELTTEALNAGGIAAMLMKIRRRIHNPCLNDSTIN